MPRSNIALLYVGGSIGMKVNQRTGRIEPIEDPQEIHRLLPELQREVALKFIPLTNVGSSEVQPADWVTMCAEIERLYDNYDGFVVVHGTNTMSYTAAALSFALQNLSKPIVLTGALHPLNDIAGDGRMNLIYAIRAAQLDIAEVCVCVGPVVLRGCRVKKIDESLFRTFESPGVMPLAEFGSRVELSPDRKKRRKRQMTCKAAFDPAVTLVTLYPGMPDSLLDAVLTTKPRGVVVQAFGPGMFPDKVTSWFRDLIEQGALVVLTSQSLHGSVDLSRFRKQLAIEKLGVLSGKDMTYETAVVKTMWALANASSVPGAKKLLLKNCAGEMTE